MSRQARQPSQKDAGKLLHLGTRQIKRLLKQYRKHDTKGWKLIKAILGTEVTGIVVSGDQVREVQTTLGAVKTGMILNAAEPW